MTAESCDDVIHFLEALLLLSAVVDRRYKGGMKPPRLKRLDRVFRIHPLYFVTACTENRQRILANKTVHECFRRFCETGLSRGVFIGKYVLMPDHLHLF